MLCSSDSCHLPPDPFCSLLWIQQSPLHPPSSQHSSTSSLTEAACSLGVSPGELAAQSPHIPQVHMEARGFPALHGLFQLSLPSPSLMFILPHVPSSLTLLATPSQDLAPARLTARLSTPNSPFTPPGKHLQLWEPRNSYCLLDTQSPNSLLPSGLSALTPHCISRAGHPGELGV